MAPTDFVTIVFINASAEGRSGEISVPTNMSLVDLVLSKVPGYSPEKYNVRLVRGDVTYGKKKSPLDMNTTLQEGDEVKVSPAKPAMA